MNKLKTGRPSLVPEERKVPISFGVIPEHRKLLTFLSRFCNYKERASFLYDFMLTILANEKFIINVPGNSAQELRKEYKASTAILNQLNKELFHLAKWRRNCDSEFKALHDHIEAHSKLTKALYDATFTRMTSTPITPDFWQKLQIAQSTNNLELLPIAQDLQNKKVLELLLAKEKAA